MIRSLQRILPDGAPYGVPPARPRALLLATAVLLLLGCEDTDAGAELARRAPQPGPTRTAPILDVVDLAAGDTVQGLRVDSFDIDPDPLEPPGWMGWVHYSGEVWLSGEYRPHPDYPDVEEPCFWVDDSTAVRLPRFPNDVRRSWFCFSNPDEAEARLGPAGSTRSARIVVDRFHYLYRHTDTYNRARLARVPEGAANP